MPIRCFASWLVDRVLDAARTHGYVAFTAALIEPWRLSIAGLTRAIGQALAASDGLPHDYPADASPSDDPISTFALVEADRHRARGVTLPMAPLLRGEPRMRSQSSYEASSNSR